MLRITDRYAEQRKIGFEVHKTILARKIPAPNDIASVFDSQATKPYYLMHALFYGLEHESGRTIPDYQRRDEKPLQVHAFDSAFKPMFRYNRGKFASGYLLSGREIKAIHVHDVPEDVGQNVRDAYLLVDIIGSLFGEETAKDVGALTNFNALVRDSIDTEVKILQRVSPDVIYSLLKKQRDGLKLGQGEINDFYRKVSRNLNEFGEVALAEKEFSDQSRKDLVSLLSDLEAQAGRIRPLDRGPLKRTMVHAYDHVLSIIKRGEYHSLDDKLTHNGDAKTLLELDLTLYRDFIGTNTDRVRDGSTLSFVGDSYLAPAMAKVAEQTDTVSNMDFNYRNVVRIFCKAEISILEYACLIRDLRISGREYQRLQKAVEYMHKNLEASIKRYHSAMRQSSEQDTKMTPELEGAQVMLERLGEMKKKIDENKESMFTSLMKRVPLFSV